MKLFNNENLGAILILYKIFAVMAWQMPDTNEKFSTLLALIGKSGSRKTSVANAFFNPLQNPCFNASFEDTEAAVKRQYRDCRDYIMIVDDMSKLTKHHTDILEILLRISGDKATSGKIIKGGKVVDTTHKSGVVVTGEKLPFAQTSSLARLLVLEFDENTVNLNSLSELQKHPEVLMSFEVYVIQWMIKHPENINKFIKNFYNFRNLSLKNDKFWHSRCSSTLAWFKAGAKLFNCFFDKNLVNIENLEMELKKIFQEMWANYGKGDPIFNYKKELLQMIETGELKITNNFNSPDSIKKVDNCIIFCNKIIFNKVINKIIENGGDADISNKKLLNILAKENILVKYNGKNSQGFKFNDGIQRRCTRLNLITLKNSIYGSLEMEEEI